MANYRLIIFDMEGTIFKKVIKKSRGETAPSAWTLIARHLGKDAFDEEENTLVNILMYFF